jgi:TDG/mug DNA glycosylase family protein
VLCKIGLIDRQLKPQEFREVLKYGLGLTDLAKQAAGRDAELSYEDFDAAGLRTRIEFYCPKVLCFNGKKAAQIFLEKRVGYGLQEDSIGDTRIFVAPSTSGAASGFWDIRVWLSLAALIKEI